MVRGVFGSHFLANILAIPDVTTWIILNTATNAAEGLSMSATTVPMNCTRINQPSLFGEPSARDFELNGESVGVSREEWERRFEMLWKAGNWQPIGKAASKAAFLRQIRTPQDWQDIQDAAREVNDHILLQVRGRIDRGETPREAWHHFVLHGQTFFGEGLRGGKNWRCWVPRLNK